MQPYVFPYLGYFQLIAAVDRFVIYDDVAYIKQGWINRNRILIGDKASYFTIPLIGASSFRLICDIKVMATDWRTKLLKTFEQAYARAPQFANVLPLVHDVLSSGDAKIGDLARRSLLGTCDYLGITTAFVESSTVYQNQHLSGEDRVLDICRREGCSTYINAIGGQELYSKETFTAQNIAFRFLKSEMVEYRQRGNTFVPWLSIIDVLMFNDKEHVRSLLRRYELV